MMKWVVILFLDFSTLYSELQIFVIWNNHEFGVLMNYLLTYLQFSIIKWAKQRPGQNPINVKFDEAIQI